MNESRNELRVSVFIANEGNWKEKKSSKEKEMRKVFVDSLN